MISIYGTEVLDIKNEVEDGYVIHPPLYFLKCKDKAENKFDIETSEQTFKEVRTFLSNLES